MSNPFCHLQLNTGDRSRAKEFYGALFEWAVSDIPMPEGSYTTIEAGDGPGGGMNQNASDEMPAHWLPYVAVDDVRAYTEKAQSLGAQVIQDSISIPGMGAFSILSDPTGAVFGIWEAAQEE